MADKVKYTEIEYEQERASNIYLMSLAVAIVGLPLPVINFLATIFMFISNRKRTWFIRWHSMQALLSQALVAVINATGVYWTMHILFSDWKVSNSYVAYVITAVIFNLIELFGTVYAAIQVRKGYHVEFLFFGPLTDIICGKNPDK